MIHKPLYAAVILYDYFLQHRGGGVCGMNSFTTPLDLLFLGGGVESESLMFIYLKGAFDIYFSVEFLAHLIFHIRCAIAVES